MRVRLSAPPVAQQVTVLRPDGDVRESKFQSIDVPTRMRILSGAILFMLAADACSAQSGARARQARFWGFAAPWDAASDATIRAHGHNLSAVVSGWIGLDSASGRPLLPSPYADTVRPRAGTAERFGMVTSWHGERFHTTSILRLARDRAALARAAGAIAKHAREMGYTGLIIDFETLQPQQLDAQITVMRAIADSARRAGVRTIAAAVPATDTTAYPAKPLLRVVDAIIPMLYDEHWAGSKPGAVASPDWAKAALALRVREAGAGRVIAGFPTYGYRWIRGKPTEAVGFADAARVAAQAGVQLARDAATQSLVARTPAWELWLADATTLSALVRIAEEQGVHRFALWRLGREDPGIWSSVVR
jgi:spore germination protein YaaH